MKARKGISKLRNNFRFAKPKLLDAFLAGVLFFLVLSSFAHTWQPSPSGPIYGGPVAMSADGRIICAVPSGIDPYFSINSGLSWYFVTNGPKLPGFVPGGLAVSADGTRVFAFLKNDSTNAVFLTTNQGNSWTQTGFPSPMPSCCIACSADGTKVIVGARNGPIYYSTNSGMNCYTSAAPTVISSVASSADGAQMLAVAGGNALYFSEDFGASWTTGNSPTTDLSSICLSSDGEWIGLVSGSGSYISSDSGTSWRTNTIPGRAIACSHNGDDWIITGDQVYTSIDSGFSWTTNLANVSSPTWYTCAVSADGCEMLAMGPPGSYVGRLTPTPQVKIQSQPEGVQLTWLTPSTNFVLWQSSDFTTANWITISNKSTLNFTNLLQEVVLPLTPSNAFFRLQAE